MRFKGSIIITDPCYICKDEDWNNIAFDDDLMGIGFKNAIKGDTIYGDWSCTTFSSHKSNPIEARTKENIIPSLKEEVLNHKGCILLRGDSGDPVEVVTKTVFKLWDIFGGSINSKGYKVLDPHVKAIYGDSITQERCEKIYEVLKSNGFAACNVSLGVGSFSMHCLMQGSDVQVFTRDSYGVAIKACYGEFKDENGDIICKSIYKDPKTDRETGHGFKKSHKGCCIVTKDSNGNLVCEDDYYLWENTHKYPNLLIPIFKDNRFLRETSLSEIRNRLHNNKF